MQDQRRSGHLSPPLSHLEKPDSCPEKADGKEGQMSYDAPELCPIPGGLGQD